MVHSHDFKVFILLIWWCSMLEINSTPLYYGKSPARGDFLKSKGQYALIQLLDQWITEALEQVIYTADFEKNYAAFAPLDFFIANTEKNILLVANMIASEDSSGRKFPMVLCHGLEVLKLNQYLSYLPHTYQSVLIDLCCMNQALRKITDANILMAQLSNLESKISVVSYAQSQNFLSQHTLHSLAQLMKINLTQLIQSMLALGLLLQPILSQGIDRLNKILILPLNNSLSCYEIALFWISLIHQFLPFKKANLLIGILHQDKPLLFFGFQGINIKALSDLFQNNLISERWVSLVETNWLDDYLDKNEMLKLLEEQLNQHEISLDQAIQLFTHSFIGERL